MKSFGRTLANCSLLFWLACSILLFDMTSDKNKLQEERARLLRRIGEIDEILRAFAVLEKHGVGLNGKPVETPARQQVRAVIERFAADEQRSCERFTLRDVKAAMKRKISNMTLRTALSELCEEGVVVIVDRGSRGKPTQYRLTHELFPEVEETQE